MSNQDDIPVLDDLIEKGIEITLSDLGLDDQPQLRVEDVLAADIEFGEDDAAAVIVDSPARTEPSVSAMPEPAAPSDPFSDNPALEQAIRRILDEHMELALQEIRMAIQQHLDRS